MKYITLYDTQINNEFKAKGEMIEFQKGTDDGYIHSLLRNRVIKEAKIEELEDQTINSDQDNQDLKSKKQKINRRYRYAT